ncbi:MAG: hypothetical protein QOD26_1829 [Betaproteobacteria bacterium]|nr:hypothetical protein [Betaproteobacteria bacterium]
MTPLAGLEASAFGQAVRDWFPLVKSVHLAGVALLLCTIAAVDLRLLGFLRDRSVKRLAGKLLPWTAGSFLLIVPSGLAMFVGYASDLIASQIFVLKICLILCAGVNAAVFHAGVFRSAASWDAGVPPPAAARAAGAVSLALWASVVTCGLLL